MTGKLFFTKPFFVSWYCLNFTGYVTCICRNQKAFISLNDHQTQFTYIWGDGTPLTFSNWQQGRPENSKNVYIKYCNWITFSLDHYSWFECISEARTCCLIAVVAFQTMLTVCMWTITPTVCGTTLTVIPSTSVLCAKSVGFDLSVPQFIVEFCQLRSFFSPMLRTCALN